MPEIIATTVFKFSELSDRAKERARQWWRETDDFDADYLYEDFIHRNDTPPKSASFCRTSEHRKEPENSTRTLQVLYLELMTSLSEAFPADPAARSKSMPLIPGGSPWTIDRPVCRLPKGAVKALRDLWALFCWHSHAAFDGGYEKGKDLLGSMNRGESTFEEMQKDIARQSELMQGRRSKIIKGKTGVGF